MNSCQDVISKIGAMSYFNLEFLTDLFYEDFKKLKQEIEQTTLGVNDRDIELKIRFLCLEGGIL